jgi:hypothetical protein
MTEAGSTSKRPPRVDADGSAFAGSQLQTQLYVNKRTDELDTAIRQALPALDGARLEWRSPLASEDYREYWDAAFLKVLGLDEHVEALARFWPTGGPHWDALAVFFRPEGAEPGVVIVEGKSYPGEMLNGSAAAAEPGSRSRTLIEQALAWTQGRLGIDLDVDSWTGPLYQNANRLAMLLWLRQRGVDAWLVHLLFTEDRRSSTTVEQWQKALASADETLGLNGIDVPWAAHVTLPAGTYAELAGPTTSASEP